MCASPSNHQSPPEAIATIVERGDVLCVMAQNLIECWADCTRPVENNGLGLLPAQAVGVLPRVEGSTVRLSDETDAAYAEWKQIVAAHGVSGKKSHDARLVAAMNISGITPIDAGAF